MGELILCSVYTQLTRARAQAGPKKDIQLTEVDLVMGVHFTSQIVNPPYIRRPSLLTLPMLKDLYTSKPHFAISIVSDCRPQFRNAYLDHLTDYLGPDRIHRYGDCGNHALPPKPINNAIKVIQNYKFYLSFENTIQDGYVTEKLFTVLRMRILPVYLGALDAPNITLANSPCFVRVSDFPTPKHLAEHLLRLDRDANEYNKYFQWRSNPSLFDPSYLDLVANKAPGKDENSWYKSAGAKFNRRALCCRLCDGELLAKLKVEHDQAQYVVHEKWTDSQIQKVFFKTGMARPGSQARLD